MIRTKQWKNLNPVKLRDKAYRIPNFDLKYVCCKIIQEKIVERQSNDNKIHKILIAVRKIKLVGTLLTTSSFMQKIIINKRFMFVKLLLFAYCYRRKYKQLFTRLQQELKLILNVNVFKKLVFHFTKRLYN